MKRMQKLLMFHLQDITGQMKEHQEVIQKK